MFEHNPLYHGPFPPCATESEDSIPDHCRPLSPDRDGLDSSSEQLSPGGAPEGSVDGLTDGDLPAENSAFTEGGPQEPLSGNGPADSEQQYASESSVRAGGAPEVQAV